jgi:hypothetical protein
MPEIKLPRNPDSIIGKVWALCDKIAAKQEPSSVDRQTLFDSLPDIKRTTVSAQFQRWRTYHGLANLRGPRADKGAAKPKATAKKTVKKATKKAAPKKKKTAKKVAKKRAVKKSPKKKSGLKVVK